MQSNSARWTTVTESEFAHEREGLAEVRDLLPDRAPYRAWSNFEFQDSRGGWHEVDLLVLGEGRLHLVELKHYQQTVRGNAYVWQVGNRSEDSPLIGARRKAQRLKSLLTSAAERLGYNKFAVPFIQESVLLHAEHSRVLLAPEDTASIFGLDGREASTHLEGISSRLLESARDNRTPVDAGIIDAVVAEAGFAIRREREVGSWRLIGPLQDVDEATQDWQAEHRSTRTPARVRFHLSGRGASELERRTAHQIVMREFTLTRVLRHAGIIVPDDLVEDDIGIGLVFPVNKDERTLDLWLADNLPTLSITDRLGLIRQLAEAVQYAHSRSIAHRMLSPRAVYVTRDSRDKARLQIGGWQQAGMTADATAIAATRHEATRHFQQRDADTDGTSIAATSYGAPEGRWHVDADRVALDIFGLGAISHLILTGQPPATSVTELNERLKREDGLDIAASLPEASQALRDLVLFATAPVVSQRLDDVGDFIKRLADAEAEESAPAEVDVDPLEAPPGTVLEERFVVLRRLGTGSTAAAILVQDRAADDDLRVLKIALNDDAAKRLVAEAATLGALTAKRTPRIVRALERSPLKIGERRALLLEYAGDETLADVLRQRGRLSLDLLERWGVDLLTALVTLDDAKVDHRDIKPSNLGVREQASDRAKHLALFDFSLASASADQIEAGTPPYLDPFLGVPPRTRWDGAAELYAASATLYEMAVGHTPVFGDGATAPQFTEGAVIDAEDFGKGPAAELAEFFRRALAKDASQRFDTAAVMLREWKATLSPSTTQIPEDADTIADRASLATPLDSSGLTPRALSALAPLHVATVKDLLSLNMIEVNQIPGLVHVTKREINARAKQWRERLGEQYKETAADEASRPVTDLDHQDPLRDVTACAQYLVEAAGTSRAKSKRRAAAVLLGLDGDVPAFAVGTAFAKALGVGGQPQAWMALTGVRAEWSKDAMAVAVLDSIYARVQSALKDFGGVAWTTELATALKPTAPEDSKRVLEGLVRVVLDRADDQHRGASAGAETKYSRRRMRSGPVLIASHSSLPDLAPELGDRAQTLLDDAAAVGEYLIPRTRAIATLREHWNSDEVPVDDVALVRVAARFAERVGVTTSGDLFALDMPPAKALRIALADGTPTRALSPAELKRLVELRLPGVGALPRRPSLDDVVTASGLGLVWQGSGYSIPSYGGTTTATTTRLPGASAEGADSDLVHILTDSVDKRGFLALGVSPRRAERLKVELRDGFDADECNVTDVLLNSLRERAAQAGVPWEAVMAADAEAEDSEGGRGLRALVEQSLADLTAAIDTALANGKPGPLLLTDVAPLARYGHLGLLGRYTDLAAARARAVWLLIPEESGMGAMVDRASLPLSAPNQFIHVSGALSTAEGVPA